MHYSFEFYPMLKKKPVQQILKSDNNQRNSNQIDKLINK